MMHAVLSAAVAASAADFSALAVDHGVYSLVELAYGPRGRGLFVTQDVRAGEPIVVVPWSLCLVADGGAADPCSPWDAPSAHGRDTLLATQLLQALGGSLSPEAISLPEDTCRFWQKWSEMLPALGTTAHPLTLPDSLVDQLQDGELTRAAALQKARADALLGD